MIQQHPKNRLTATKTLLGVVFLVCGCMIYLLFRSKSLNIYLWSKTIGLSHIIDALRRSVGDWQVNDNIRYCLPDGLFCLAYILLIDAIWQDDERTIKYIMIALVPIIAIVHELLQLYGFVKGTFDITDLVCYSLPLAIYFMLINIKKYLRTN